jgi:hypothetical protein
MPHRSSEFPDTQKSVSRQLFLCKICHLAVPIETCKTDEAGQPIHEQCYLDALSKTDVTGGNSTQSRIRRSTAMTSACE